MSVASDMLQVAKKWDYVRIAVFIALVAGITMHATATFGAKNQPWNFKDFAEGFILILGAGAVASWTKSKEDVRADS